MFEYSAKDVSEFLCYTSKNMLQNSDCSPDLTFGLIAIDAG